MVLKGKILAWFRGNASTVWDNSIPSITVTYWFRHERMIYLPSILIGIKLVHISDLDDITGSVQQTQQRKAP